MDLIDWSIQKKINVLACYTEVFGSNFSPRHQNRIGPDWHRTRRLSRYPGAIGALPCYEILGLTGVFAARMAAECQALQAVGLSAHPKGAVKRTNFEKRRAGQRAAGLLRQSQIHVHCHLRQFCLNVSLAMILHGRRLLFVPMLVQQQIVGMSL